MVSKVVDNLYLSTLHPSFLLETIPFLFHVARPRLPVIGPDLYTLAVQMDPRSHLSPLPIPQVTLGTGHLTKSETLIVLPSKYDIKFGKEIYPFDSNTEGDELRAVISPSQREAV